MELERSSHIEFLKNGLGKLGSGHQCLDASQPWLIYWITNSLDLLNCIPDQYQAVSNPDNIPQSTFSNIINFLKQTVDAYKFIYHRNQLITNFQYFYFFNFFFCYFFFQKMWWILGGSFSIESFSTNICQCQCVGYHRNRGSVQFNQSKTGL